MAVAIYVPIVIVVYLFFMIWYSTVMAKVLKTNLAILILVGIFLWPIWIILAIVSLSYQTQESRPSVSSTPKASPKKTPRFSTKKTPRASPKKTPKKKTSKK